MVDPADRFTCSGRSRPLRRYRAWRDREQARDRRRVPGDELRLCRLRYTGLVSEVASFELPQAQRKRIAALVNGPDGGGPLAVRTDQGEVELPPTARAAVRRLLADLAAGTAVHLLTDDTELTTQDAADILGISRTYVVRLVDNGKLPAHLVGTHRRLRAVDILAYKTRRDARLAGADAVAEADIAAGVPYR